MNPAPGLTVTAQQIEMLTARESMVGIRIAIVMELYDDENAYRGLLIPCLPFLPTTGRAILFVCAPRVD